MPKKITTEKFKSIIYEKEGNNYTLMGEVIDAKTKVKIKHNVCNHIYEIPPSNFKSGSRCPLCAKRKRVRTRKGGKRKTHKEFCEEVFNSVGEEYTVNTEYKKWDCKVSFTHNYCGFNFDMVPNSFLNGRRCPQCSKNKSNKKRSTSNEDFVKKVNEKYNKEYIPLEKYINNHTKIKVKHENCGTIWNTKPANLLAGFGCPLCKQSKGERMISKYLKDKKITYEHQKKFKDLRVKNELSYDFYLPEHSILIEYQGQQHYYPVELFGGVKSFEKQVKYDNIKRKYSLKNKMTLVEIPYTANTYDKVSEILDEQIISVK